MPVEALKRLKFQSSVPCGIILLSILDPLLKSILDALAMISRKELIAMIFQKYIVAGQGAFTLCCLFYVAWWYVAYNPKITEIHFGGILFWITFAFGVAGIYLNICGIRNLDVSVSKICLIGSAAYIVLLAVTILIFRRQVTAELFLIVAWATLETCAIFATFLEIPQILLITVAAVSIFAIIAYLLYYSLDELTAFYLGLVPLILDAICAAFIAFYIVRRFNL